MKIMVEGGGVWSGVTGESSGFRIDGIDSAMAWGSGVRR